MVLVSNKYFAEHLTTYIVCQTTVPTQDAFLTSKVVVPCVREVANSVSMAVAVIWAIVRSALRYDIASCLSCQAT